MASTLACLGMEVGDVDQLGDVLQQLPGELVGRVAGEPGVVETVRYADASGARVLVGRVDGGVVDLVPSYAAEPGARLAGLGVVGDLVAADVLDEAGETATRLLCDLEQRRHVPVEGDGTVEAAVVALGVEMSVHADDAAFAASDASLLGEPEPGEEPHRWAAGSFVSYGLFASASGGEADPTAFLAGTVLESDTRTHGVTGQEFHAVLVETIGFTATVCLAATDHPTPPSPGNVVAGLCYLVADAPTLWSVQEG